MSNDDGDVFYPDSPEDARYFAEQHGARPTTSGVSGSDGSVRDALSVAAKELRRQASTRFDQYGPHDARGAAFWDVAAWIDPDDHNALHVAQGD